MNTIDRLSATYGIPTNDLMTAIAHMLGIMESGDSVLLHLIEDTQQYVRDINDKTSPPARGLRFFKLLQATQNNKQMFARIALQFIEDDTDMGFVTMMGILATYARSFNLQHIMEVAEDSDSLRTREGDYLREMNVIRDFYKISQFYEREDE